MRLQINLRGDLAKLTDQELADRLQVVSQNYDSLSSTVKWSGIFWSRRGPIRHPWAYLLIPLFPLALIWRNAIPYNSGEITRHLTLCELRDLVDEMERRVMARRRSATTA